MNKDIRPALFAEFLGTFALLFFGCGTAMFAGLGLGNFQVPFAFGLVIMVMVYTLGHISGAHFNPAVTLGFALSKRFDRQKVLPYITVQICGALLATFFLWCIDKGLKVSNQGAGGFNLQSGIGGFLYRMVNKSDILARATTTTQMPWQIAIIIEAILTFFLMYVILAVATDTRAHKGFAGVAIGGIIALGAFAFGPITGASMNPARSLAPAIFAGGLSLHELWIYILGPIAGSLCAALVYNAINSMPNPDEPENISGNPSIDAF